MKLHLSSNLLTLAMMATVAGSAFAAEPTVEVVSPVNEASYSKTWTPARDSHTTVQYSTVKSEGDVYIRTSLRGDSTLNIEAESIEAAGKVSISTSSGDVTLGDVKAGDMQISTQKGNITLTGNIQSAAADGSTISVSCNGTPGNIILDGASISNVGLTNSYWDENWQQAFGSYAISGDTTLSGVYFGGGTVDVAEGAKLSLDNVLFTTRENSNKGMSADTSLVLGDNVTLTLNAGDTIDVKSLSIGNDVDIIITLSNDEFLALDDSEFNVFSVVDGEIDFSNVNFTFTDGEQYKSGTVSSTGGSICVTGSQLIVIPEPTTATLSLLALCGLAARRRRK